MLLLAGCLMQHIFILSKQMAYDAKLMRVPEIRWLGVFPSEFERYCLPDRCLLRLTPEGNHLYILPHIFCFIAHAIHQIYLLHPGFHSDKKKAQAIMSRCYLHQEAPQWRLTITYIYITHFSPMISLVPDNTSHFEYVKTQLHKMLFHSPSNVLIKA